MSIGKRLVRTSDATTDMHPIAPVHAQAFDQSVAESIAHETGAPIELASRTFREELDALASKARITQFLHVIARRWARPRLRAH
jgi:Protein of unknown function (DUF3562)